MQIITITIDAGDDGQPAVRLLHSDGVSAEDGVRACTRAVEAFRAMAIEAAIDAEVARRLAERGEGEG